MTPSGPHVPFPKKEEISVVILTSRGPRHSYFCHELARHYSVRAIVVDDRYHFWDRGWNFFKTNGFNPFRMARSVTLKRMLSRYEVRDQRTEEAFFSSKNGGREFPAGIPIRMSRDPNREETVQWIRGLSPDVLAVFGTRLIREPLLSVARLGALNLHTGLSPFYRGGQCTFWCLYEGDLEHVGVTVHHLSERIDGGDIIYQAKPEIGPGDTVRSIECKLIELGTERMIQAVRELSERKAPRTPQREKGRLFLSKMFTLEKRIELEKKLEQGWLARLLTAGNRKNVLI